MRLTRAAVALVASVLCSYLSAAPTCKNLVRKPYKPSPQVFAPPQTLGDGIHIWMGGKATAIPDRRPACLPIPLRYNNPGAIKTRDKTWWPHQVAKDNLGHAVFNSVENGIAAWGLWIREKYESGRPYSAFDIMSVYAPPTDCVGSARKAGRCIYGLNPTKLYANRVAAGVGKKAHDPLDLNGANCREARDGLYALFRVIASFEIGGNFCGRKDDSSAAVCEIDRNMFNRALDSAFNASCSTTESY